MVKKNIRGLQGDATAPQQKDQLVRPMGQRIRDWFIIPSNAVLFMCALAIGSYIFSMAAAGFYLTVVGYFLYKFCIAQLERPPLKIPLQDKLLDINELRQDQPTMGKGMMFIGTEFVSNKEVWLTNDDTRQHFLILGTTGAGKASDINALVYTPTGWRRIGDLKVGDAVTTPFNSESATVTGVYPQGVRQLWQVTFKDGRTAEVDREHLWEIHHKHWNNEYKIIKTSEIHMLMKEGQMGFEVIVSDPVDNMSENLPIVPYDLGRYLSGDEFAIDEYLVEKYELNNDAVYAFIPQQYLNGSFEQRISLLCGLCEDLHIVNNKIIYQTTSSVLSDNIKKLVWSLGGLVETDKKNRLLFSFNSKKVTSVLNKKLEPISLKNEIIDIRPLDKHEECVCIMVDHPRHLYIMDDYVVTHNTEILTSFAANALSWGSGLIFVDGKGDIKLMASMHALAKRWGRGADFLVLNFMPPGDMAPGEIASNTMNPYTTAPPSDIIQQIGGLMPQGGGDGMWKDRAMTMVSAVVYALAWARDNGIMDLDISTMRNFIQFRNLITLVDENKFPGMPNYIRENLHIYLSSLAGYNGKPEPNQSDDCLKQHGFLEMQFTGPFGSLANDYGHIFSTEFGEVDMFDVVLNRRILVVMLPSLQKSPEDVERMGKIVVASLKTMMGATLGNIGKTKGGKVLDTVTLRVTTAPYPCLVILDEVGYYTVPGMAMMAAQVRSLGFSMIYASQDLKAMTRLNDKEAQSIIANTNTKIIMRTEDDETMSLAVKSGGKSQQVRSRSYETRDNIFGNMEWSPNQEFAIEFEERINGLDLKSQREGEFTLLYMDKIVRGRSFYADVLGTYKRPDDLAIPPNQFINVRRPNITAVESEKRIPRIIQALNDTATLNAKRAEFDNIKSSEDISTFISGLGVARQESNRKLVDVVGLAVALVVTKTEESVDSFTNTIKNTRGGMIMDMEETFMNKPETRNNSINPKHGVEIDHGGIPDINPADIIADSGVLDALSGLQFDDDDMKPKSMDDIVEHKYEREHMKTAQAQSDDIVNIIKNISSYDDIDDEDFSFDKIVDEHVKDTKDTSTTETSTDTTSPDVLSMLEAISETPKQVVKPVETVVDSKKDDDKKTDGDDDFFSEDDFFSK